MPLFFGKRDISLIRHVNREFIHDIADIQVDVYKVHPEYTKTNLYGESDQKIYYTPIRLHCLVNRQPEQYTGDNTLDYTINAEFYFLRDDLRESEYVVEVGDIVNYNGEYYEIDSIGENQYASGKNPQWAYSGTSHGWNVSIIANGHVTNRTVVTIEDVRPGSTPNNDLPRMI